MQRSWQRIACLLAMLCCAHIAAAQPVSNRPATETQEQRVSEAEAAMKAALAASTHGPSQITLNDQGKLRLPAHTAWVPRAPANRLLVAWGNAAGDNTIGMVLAASGDQLLPGIVSYTPSGYIKDGDAADLDAASILDNIRQSTERENEGRAARGFPALSVGAWAQMPRYDAVRKRLIWAFPLTDRDRPGAQSTINYNTRALGRYGYFSLNLLTDPAHFTADKQVADELLGGLIFQPGKAYADFNAGTDHVAAYGLAALIGVVALKKLGLIAIAGVFLLKFAKIGALAVFGGAAAVRRFLRRKKPGPVTQKPESGPWQS